MPKIIFAAWWLVLFPACLGAQLVNVSGYVKSAATGEALIGAAIQDNTHLDGRLSDEYGYFSIQIPVGEATALQCSYVGYGTWMDTLTLTEDLQLTIELEEADEMLETVDITASTLSDKLNSSQMSVDQLSMVEAKALPALFGEVDIIKTLQLKPGVQSGGEGTSGLYVRGGGPDQNLILLDEAQIYNASHLFGFFSTFNSDAVKGVKLFKGGFPAEYGGRLSSVIDVRLNEGNKKRFAGSGGIGLIASRLTLEGPIKKDKASFMLSGRRTYFDVFTRAANQLFEDRPNYNPIPDYYFYDFNGKVNYELGPKDQLFLSGYLGRDVFGFSSDNFGIDFTWGNKSATARWNHIFSPKLLLKTIGTFSSYDYEIRNSFSQFDFRLGSGIEDVSGRTELVWQPGNRHTVKGGLNYTYHSFSIARFEASSEDNTVNFDSGQDFFGHELGAYVNEEFRANNRLTLQAGLRWSAFESGGTFYNGWEPRASAKYSLSDRVAVKASYARMFQYVHMVSNSGASLPTDIWYPSNAVVTPQKADQAATGVSFLIGDHILLTNEVYYKWLDRQVDFRDGAQIFFNPNLDEEFVFGRGWGYGNEIYIEKTKGMGTTMWDRLSGWIGYTYSWAWREFPDINGGEPFHPRYDRRHDVSVVVIQELNKRWSITGAWVYGTGQAVSLPIGRFAIQGAVPGSEVDIIPEYLERNSFRMPAYHRGDLGVVYKMFPRWGESDLTFSIYNFYNRRNPYFIYYDTIENNQGEPTRFVPKQVSLFPIIPSATWNFKF